MRDEKKIHAIKGFDRDLKCRGFPFQVGQTYVHEGKVKACESGFHSIEGNPLEVFHYYLPTKGNRFCSVIASGSVSREEGDSKIASRFLHVERELTLAEVVAAAIAWKRRSGKVKTHSMDLFSVAHSEERQNVASASGYASAASAAGVDSAAITAGSASVAFSSGVCSAAVALGAASVAVATGTHSAALATANLSTAHAENGTSCAFSSGFDGIVSGVNGAAICAVERGVGWEILSVACGIVGKDGLREGVKYKCADGKLVEA